MDRAYQTHLRDLLIDVYELGAASVSYRHFYRWFGRDRITKIVWADLLEEWEAVLEAKRDQRAWQLGTIENGRSDILTLICLDPANSKKSHFRPVSERAKG